MLKDIPYAVIGGVPTRMYMPERTTADIDLLLEPENFERAISQLIENGYDDELLNAYVFTNIFSARAIAEAWRQDYNENRPHSALG
jgi:transposase InsO family protein